MSDEVINLADSRRELESKISLVGLSIQQLQAQVTKYGTRKHQLEGLGVTQPRDGTIDLLRKFPHADRNEADATC